MGFGLAEGRVELSQKGFTPVSDMIDKTTAKLEELVGTPMGGFSSAIEAYRAAAKEMPQLGAIENLGAPSGQYATAMAGRQNEMLGGWEGLKPAVGGAANVLGDPVTAERSEEPCRRRYSTRTLRCYENLAYASGYNNSGEPS